MTTRWISPGASPNNSYDIYIQKESDRIVYRTNDMTPGLPSFITSATGNIPVVESLDAASGAIGR